MLDMEYICDQTVDTVMTVETIVTVETAMTVVKVKIVKSYDSCDS